MRNRIVLALIIFISLLITNTACRTSEKKGMKDDQFPSGIVDTIYKIHRTSRGTGAWFSAPFPFYDQPRYYPDTIEVKEGGHYTMWTGKYKDGSLYFIWITKYAKTFEERKLQREQDVAPVSVGDSYTYYFKEMYPDGKLCTEVYYDQRSDIISKVLYNQDGKLIYNKKKNRNYREEFYDNGNRKSFTIPNLLYVLWYESGKVSSFDIQELETLRFYEDGTLAFYQRRGIPNAQYTWDTLGQPFSILYHTHYPQWQGPLDRAKMDSIKSMIDKQDWMTGLPNKFNPESFKFTHFENEAPKIVAHYSDNPAKTSIEVYDPSGQLFKNYEDASDHRSKISIAYFDKYNSTLRSVLSNPKLEDLWRIYGYDSNKMNEVYVDNIILSQPQEFMKVEIRNHEYNPTDEITASEINPLNYLYIYETNARGIDTSKLNKVLKNNPYSSNSEVYLKTLVSKLKGHTALVLHKNEEVCDECEESYPPPLKSYHYGNLASYINNLSYQISDYSIKICTVLGDYLVVEYKYFYTVNNDGHSAPLSMTEYYLVNTKSNLLSPSLSILNPNIKTKLNLYLKQKFKKLKIDSLQEKSILKELVLLPRFQSFDILIHPDYHSCGERDVWEENEYINLSLNEMKPFLNLEHPLIKWMNSVGKGDEVQNRNQDYFKNIEQEEFIQNGISFDCFKNSKVDTVIVFAGDQFIAKYALNKKGQPAYKESIHNYREKTKYSYYENGLLKKVTQNGTDFVAGSMEHYSIHRQWDFDVNGNLKTFIDSSSNTSCEPLVGISHYYNFKNYTYIDKGLGYEKQFYKNDLLKAVIRQTNENNYGYDTTLNKRITTPDSYSILKEGHYYTYNKSGKLIKQEDQLGTSIYEFLYDEEGRLIKYMHKKLVNNSYYLIDRSINYYYDSESRIDKFIKTFKSEYNSGGESIYTVEYK